MFSQQCSPSRAALGALGRRAWNWRSGETEWFEPELSQNQDWGVSLGPEIPNAVVWEQESVLGSLRGAAMPQRGMVTPPSRYLPREGHEEKLCWAPAVAPAPSSPVQAPYGHFQSQFTRARGEIRSHPRGSVLVPHGRRLCAQPMRSSPLHYCLRTLRKSILKKKKVRSDGKNRSLCQQAAAQKSHRDSAMTFERHHNLAVPIQVFHVLEG